MNFSVPTSRTILRKQLRTARRALSRAQQRCASEQLARRISSHPVFLRSQHIALYMAEDGEIDVQLLILIAERMGKRCYLPVLHPLGHNHLWFARYQSGNHLRKNYFDLAEPTIDKTRLKPWALDLVLMPLVGFDRKGNRLGMGGGFYDRTFAFLNHTPRNKPRAPVLMGVAHQCQETAGLKREAWDVAFNYVATDKEIIKT
jgi:5-formyltetrahydrofolate cyclo-ligase